MQWAAWLTAILTFALPAPALADPARCADLYARLPDRLAGFTVAERGGYDDPALGYFVRYRSQDLPWASVFVFDGGNARIDDATVDAYFRGAIGDIQTAHERSGQTNARDFQDFSAGHPPALDRGFAVTTDGEHLDGQRDRLVMGRSGDCLVKMRHTGRASLRDEAGYDALVRALALLLAP